MIERNPAGAAIFDDMPTLAAISVAAFMTAPVIHEALGHGVTCIAMGGHVTRLSSVYFDCAPSSRLVAAMGPLLQFYATALFLELANSKRNASAPRWLLFLVLAAAFNGLWASGYFVYSGLLDTGDWAVVFRNALRSSLLWRAPSVVLGAWLYVWVLGLLARRLAVHFSHQGAVAAARVRQFIAIAYASAGLASLLAVVGTPVELAKTMVEAAQESFLAGVGLFMMPRLMTRFPTAGTPALPPIERSWPWIAITGLAFVIFATTLGRGI